MARPHIISLMPGFLLRRLSHSIEPWPHILRSMGRTVFKGKDLTSIDAIMKICGASYGTLGLNSLRTIPDGSVDFVWSHTVLQHISRAEFLETMRELRRVLREDGISSHWVDLQDMLGGGLNNLRFRESVWESSFMAGSGFYTNRIRYSEMLAFFRETGFQVEVVDVIRWDGLPTPQSKLCDLFRDLPEEELCVRCFHVILRPSRKAYSKEAQGGISVLQR